MSQKQVAELVNLVRKMDTQAGGKKKKKKAKTSTPSTPGTTGAMVTQRPARTRRRKTGPGEGAVVVSRRELMCSVTTSSGKAAAAVEIFPSTAFMPWLANLTKAFERIVWESLVIEWVPMVGTTEGGGVIFGVDWTASLAKADATRAKIAALTPVIDMPIWQAGKLVLPAKLLQSRRYYSLVSTDGYDKCPGSILVQAQSKTDAMVGELWATYRVRLLGTRPV